MFGSGVSEAASEENSVCGASEAESESESVGLAVGWVQIRSWVVGLPAGRSLLRLNSKRTLRQHMLKHSNLNSFTCDVCKAQFKRAKAFKEHLISQHTNIKAYKCSWCEKTFANGANFRKHQKEHHPKELEEDEKKNIKQIVRLPKIEELLSLSLEHGREKL